MSTRRRKVLPVRLVFLCSNRIAVNLPKVEGVPLSQCDLDSNVQLRDVQCITGQNGGISRRDVVTGLWEAIMRLLQAIPVRLSGCHVSAWPDAQDERVQGLSNEHHPGMNLIRAVASKARQGTAANFQVRRTWLVLSPPRSYDGEVHAIRHPSADSMLWVCRFRTRPSGKP